MTTLIKSAARTLIEVLESEKSQNVLSMKSGRALDALEQAIAQELAFQTASTKPVASQKIAETVDKTKQLQDMQRSLINQRSYLTQEPKP